MLPLSSLFAFEEFEVGIVPLGRVPVFGMPELEVDEVSIFSSSLVGGLFLELDMLLGTGESCTVEVLLVVGGEERIVLLTIFARSSSKIIGASSPSSRRSPDELSCRDGMSSAGGWTSKLGSCCAAATCFTMLLLLLLQLLKGSGLLAMMSADWAGWRFVRLLGSLGAGMVAAGLDADGVIFVVVFRVADVEDDDVAEVLGFTFWDAAEVDLYPGACV